MTWHRRFGSLGLASFLAGACAGSDAQGPYSPPPIDDSGGGNTHDSGFSQTDASSTTWPEASTDDTGTGGASGGGDDASNSGDDAFVSEGGAPTNCPVTFTVHGVVWPAT